MLFQILLVGKLFVTQVTIVREPSFMFLGMLLDLLLVVQFSQIIKCSVTHITSFCNWFDVYFV